ncbi:hypothetical protein OHT76_43155 [Streptomyces sp. NBC_00287]|uniref:hypothetical protein n=1 Tax=Streptomyces sp. NBC_00287 TaxID=2975702 RepID=UPI002E27B342|nr:hypothetical protein [Streptomyces sp. NBC_00287]
MACDPAVNSYGIKINHRIYDGEGLDGLQRGKSGIPGRKDRWEVRHDPYDIRLVWLRDHRKGTWVTVRWRLLSSTATPFGELAWEHAARDLREQGGGSARTPSPPAPSPPGPTKQCRSADLIGCSVMGFLVAPRRGR